MLSDMFNGGALPALERLVQFTGQRHRVLTNNIANLDTPGFVPSDLSVDSFQATLREAIEARRDSAASQTGPLDVQDTAELAFADDGLVATPTANHTGIVFHDQSSRNLEQTMADLAENTLTHKVGIELIRNEMALLETAIRGRL